MVSFLLDDCLVHLRRSSTLVRECSSAHPYPDSSQQKEAVEIENARALILEFDQRSHLKEGHAVLSIWSDADCSREISIFSGSGVCSQLDHSGSGFRPILIRGNKYVYQHHHHHHHHCYRPRRALFERSNILEWGCYDNCVAIIILNWRFSGGQS